MTNTRLALVFLTGIILSYYSVTDWHPADAGLLTKWSQYINPENVHNAYPRPQFERSRWKNLNGTWQFDFAANLENPPIAKDLSRRILIPFPIESNLSGVMESQPCMWYRQTFKLPADWQQSRILLHFDRIIGTATVYLNGVQHFTFDNCETRLTAEITKYLKAGENELLIGVKADRCTFSGTIIDAFAGHGIVQTVWLEPVPDTYLRSVDYTTSVKDSSVSIEIETSAAAPASFVEAAIFDADTLVAVMLGRAGEPMNLKLSGLKLWSPENPQLYSVNLKLIGNGAVIDSANSYIGIKDYRILLANTSNPQPYLNGEKFFQIGIVHHGFWPDGKITAPSDQAIRTDIENIKKMGFNLIINNGCMPSDRWMYWCDKTGVLVWQNMPQNYANFSAAEHERVKNCLAEYRSHASFASLIVSNLPRQKTGMQFAPTSIRYCLKKRQWNELKVQYIQPESLIFELEGDHYKYSSLGAVDGVGKIITSVRDTYPVDLFPAQKISSAAIEFNTKEYHRKLALARRQAQKETISTLIYPQFTDLPGSNFGLQTDDRRQLKVDLKKMRKINKSLDNSMNGL